MKKQKQARKSFTAQEKQLVEQLRQRPLILERVRIILEIAENNEGPLRTADQVEEVLVDEMRRLGNATMTEWATQAEKQVSAELRSQDPTVLSRKKKR